jgi:hypothetical protein
MKKTALVLLLMLLLLPLRALSKESMGTALTIVEDFSREANTLMVSRGLNPLSPVGKKKVEETLKQIRLTEVPGKGRSTKVYGVVSSYTERVVETVRTMNSTWSGNEAAVARLEKLRASMLDDLRIALASESVEKKAPTPVPSFDLSPHDEPSGEPDGDKGGILFR